MEGVSKVFGHRVVAVDQVDLEIRDQEFVTLVGPSGCGKSTTLRMIAGLERPTQGRIYFDDRVMNDVEPRDRNVAMVFQSYALYPHLDVRGNLEYGLKKRRVPRAERNRRVATIARLLQIENLLDRKPRELSGGQRQRVALGRAIIREPEVFLLDEPLSNLDAKLRVYMRAELIKLHRSIATTMIYVTHDQLEAMTMSDRIVIMYQGRIQQVGTPAEVYNHPANRFVAEFIGTPPMNFLRCRLEREGERLFLRHPLFSLPLPTPLQSKVVALTLPPALLLGIRPEAIVVLEKPEEHAFPATVSVVELTGPEQIVYMSAGEETLVARVGPDQHLTVQGTVYLRLNAEKIHLLRPDTDEVIG
ncbi:MAG: sn-glycerol-3-phosphate ABC transporter ATP-binding protein UgpC [Nitrospinota bacterium]|nr:MAG: sn-glycerol-3-phosphate ABC transporter ATP-binding protein UgpC [Nitrospinota bacterium]